MRLYERRPSLLAVTENIEMELFSSEESCVVISTPEMKEEHSFHQRHLEHPLVPLCEEDPEPQVWIQLRHRTKPNPATPVKEMTERCPPALGFMQEIEIEMEVFSPFRTSESKLVGVKSDLPSIPTSPSPNHSSRLKWRRPTPEKTGLVVKDVVCLPRGLYLAQLERHLIPHSRDREALSAMGMTTRISIDSGWSASQMESRLVTLFQGRFVKRTGQRFSFTYLQCRQGSRVLFVPDPPTEGWSGEQVLRICGHGVLYILSHQDHPQQVDSEWTANETPVVPRKEFCLESRIESCHDDSSQLGQQIQLQVLRSTEEVPSDPDKTLRRFIREDAEDHIQVRRRDLLHSALKVVRRPGFCFRTTPIVSLSGEEADRPGGPLREFFRLTLLELQQSSIFEGRPGRLFLTYDLKALHDKKYYEAGVLIGWSLAHGGPGPRCLHPTLYQLMCGNSSSLEDFSWNDVVDSKVQLWLKKLHSCTDVKLLSPSLCNWVSSCGIPDIYSARSDEIPAIYVRLVKHYIHHRVASMISQFTEGLNSCGGLWDLVQYHRETFVPVMTSKRPQPLKLDVFRKLFTVSYSRSCSQLRAAEEATVRHWEQVLTLISDVKADFYFEDLLAFITGSDHLPPFGFPTMISLRFYSQCKHLGTINNRTDTWKSFFLKSCHTADFGNAGGEDSGKQETTIVELCSKDASASSVRLPHTSTCALELFLPRGVRGDADLLVLLSRAVREARGFTCLQTQRGGGGEDGSNEAMKASLQFTLLNSEDSAGH